MGEQYERIGFKKRVFTRPEGVERTDIYEEKKAEG